MTWSVVARRSPSHLNVRPNICAVLVDTLRPDHLSIYGYQRATCPRLAGIAARGVVFDHVIAPSPWTNPTIAGLFSGQYPQAILPPARHSEAIKQRLPDEVTTIAEALRAAGFQTAAFVDHPGISPDVNYDQGFDDYSFLRNGWHEWAGSRGSDVLAEVSRQLDALAPGPFFYYVHLIYPHAPYTPPAPFVGQFGRGFESVRKAERDGLINRYDEEIRYTDHLLGAIFDQLQRRDLSTSTYFIVLSDHGEGFWEHGLWEHGNSLYDELLRVPLVVHPPAGIQGGPRRIDEPFSLIDLYPTILELAGGQVPERIDGVSFASMLTGGETTTTAPGARATLHRPLFSESPHSRMPHALACQARGFKLIYSAREPTSDRETLLGSIRECTDTALYDLSVDPGETRDVCSDHRRVADWLGLQMAGHWERQRRGRERFSGTKVELRPENLDKLKVLGYLQ